MPNRPIDKLGLGPTYTILDASTLIEGYHFLLIQTKATRPKCLVITNEEVKGFLDWQNGKLIQDALPTLNKGQREQILSGLDDTEFDEATREPSIMGLPDEVEKAILTLAEFPLDYGSTTDFLLNSAIATCAQMVQRAHEELGEDVVEDLGGAGRRTSE